MEQEGVNRLKVAVEVNFLAICVYAPLAFGSAAQVYRPPIWVMSFTLLFLHECLRMTTLPATAVGSEKHLYRPPLFTLYAFCGFLALQALFLIPLPKEITTMFSAGWFKSPSGLTAIHPSYEIGIRALLDWASAIIIFYVAVTFPDNRGQVRRILFAILAVAGFEAVYGMVEYASGNQHIFNYAKSAYLDSATGTFVNRNHFANYLGMAICVGTGMLSWYWSKYKDSKGYKKIHIEKILLFSFFMILLVAALLFSKSRAGLISVAITMTIVGLTFAKGHKRAFFGFVVIVILFSLVFAFYIGKSPSQERFLDLPKELEAKDARPAIWREAATVWAHAPLFGIGAGTFEDAIKSLGTGRLLARYLHAHNDYLQTLAEFGVIGFLLLFGGIFYCLFQTGKKVRIRNSRFARLTALGLSAAVLTLVIHSFFDFNLQIPANRITFFAILGLGYLVAGKRMTR